MAIGHIAVRTHNRAKGHTAAAALAYRHGTRLVDCHTGEARCYLGRKVRDEIIETNVLVPRRWQHGRDLQTLADLIEGAENRRNSQIIRDVQVAVPHELAEAQQIQLVDDFALALSGRYNTVVTWALHRPAAKIDPDKSEDGTDVDDKGGADERNIHAHICLPTRAVNEDGSGFGEKLRQLAVRTRSSEEVAWMRNHWQDTANGYLKAADIEARVYVGRRLDAAPEPTMPMRTPRKLREAARKKHRGRMRQIQPASGAPRPIYAPRAIAWLAGKWEALETRARKALDDVAYWTERTDAKLRDWLAVAPIGDVWAWSPAGGGSDTAVAQRVHRSQPDAHSEDDDDMTEDDSFDLDLS